MSAFALLDFVPGHRAKEKNNAQASPLPAVKQTETPPRNPVFIRNGQPVIFVSVHNESIFEFGDLSASPDHIILRVMSTTKPKKVLGKVQFWSARGTLLNENKIQFRVFEGSRLLVETGVEYLRFGTSYRLVGVIKTPEYVSTVTLRLEQGSLPPDAMVTTQAVRLERKWNWDIPGAVPKVCFAHSVYVKIAAEHPNVRLVMQLCTPPRTGVKYTILRMSDIIGTGPAFCRMVRFDQDGTFIAPSPEEAQDRNGLTLIAFPRARKPENPSHSNKVVPHSSGVFWTTYMDISMLLEGTDGYLDVLSTRVIRQAVLSEAPPRPTRENIIASYYRTAYETSKDEMERLTF
ncbi:MAG: hypothetical protein GDA52_07555 [Rhodobacteraceae bacterium]|nr:hypothetical protein [Paracoccaceae bacterium]